MVTIKDVADRAGVSMTTVSRAFNEHAAVSKDTRAKILSIAKNMGYSPNMNARGLVTRRTYVVGIFLSSLDMGTSQSFLSTIINSAYRALPSNYLLSVNDLKRLNQYKTLVRNRMDGIVVVSQSDKDDRLINRIYDDGMPLVVVNREVDDPRIHSICSDDEAGVKQAVDYVQTLGHRRLGMIEGMPTFNSSVRRRCGFDMGISLNHLQALPQAMRVGDYSLDAGEKRMAEILALPPDQWPTCMICANDDTAIGAMRACFRAGLKLPEDMSFVGFDDSPYAAMEIPALTTVRKPVEAMMREAIRWLMELIFEGEDQGSNLKIKPRLVRRESVARLE